MYMPTPEPHLHGGWCILTGSCFRCGFAPARCGSISGKARFAPRAGAVLGSAYTRLSRKELLDRLIRSMEVSDAIVTGFDENLWRLMVEKVTAGIDGKLTFTLRNGTEV